MNRNCDNDPWHSHIVRVPAREIRTHWTDVDRLIRFALKKERVQAYRHLSQDEFADLISWCWVWVLEREEEWRGLDCSLATAICTTIPYAVKSWRARGRTWERRAVRSESSLPSNDDDDRQPMLTHGDDAALRPDALVAEIELLRALDLAIGTLPTAAKADLKAMLAGSDIPHIAKGTGRTKVTVRDNILRAVGALRMALFGDDSPVRTLEPAVVSVRVRRRRERSLQWWRRKQTGETRVSQVLTSEYAWGGRKPEACLGCHSTQRRHKARGLCHRCYAKAKREGTLVEFGVILDTTPGAVNRPSTNPSEAA